VRFLRFSRKTIRRICTKFFVQDLGENTYSLQSALQSTALWARLHLAIFFDLPKVES